jgi:hypothetical protein
VGQRNNFERRNEMNSRVSSSKEGRFFRDPSVTKERSSNSPSAGSRRFRSLEGSGRFFSAPSRSFTAPSRGGSSACADCHWGNSSFRGSGGGSSTSFSGGSFSRGGGGGRGR